MKGLQTSQIDRSKAVTGAAVLEFKQFEKSFIQKVAKVLESENINYNLEYETELLLKHESQITPIIIHGVDTSRALPSYLRSSNLEELIIPFDIGAKIQAELGSKVQLISPSHVDEFFGDIPRSVSVYVEDFINTRVPEVDMLHGWTNIEVIQNLTGEIQINKAVLYGDFDIESLKQKLDSNFGEKVYFQLGF